MNKILPRLVVLALFAASCSKQTVENNAEPLVSKKVAFDVYTQKDYNDTLFDNMLAEVRLNISKSNLKNNITTVVWDTTYTFRQFKQYPQMPQKISIEKTIEHLESSELLHASTTVRYNYNGYMSMEAKSEGAQKDYNLFVVSF